MLLWWLGYAARNVAGTALGRRPGSLDLPMAELGGGLAGLTGSYARSMRRTEAIRKRHG
jgi:hypothetical protein